MARLTFFWARPQDLLNGTRKAADMGEPSFFQGTQDLSVIDWQSILPPQDSDLSECEIPDYAVLQKIGQGSYGAVWSATQSATGQKVALKVLRSGPRQGLQRELQRILEVSEHPHVVPLMDARLENDPAFLVTPLMQGSMGGYIRQVSEEVSRSSGRLAAKSEVESALIRLWMSQVASALDFVHRKGIVHCDLKPDNILLDNEGNSKVCDFGQATLLGEGGSSLGTYFFMPPEQTHLATGQEARVEPTWDVYALGATFYYLATGRHARASAELRDSLCNELDPRKRLDLYREELLKTDLVPCRELNPRLDEDLATIIERCLEIEPQKRFGTAAQVVQELSVPSSARSGVTSLGLRWIGEAVRRSPLARVLLGQPVESRELTGLLIWIGVATLPVVALLMALRG